MKNLLIYTVFAFTAIVFTSCEKVVELDLDESDRRYVIEGLLHDSLGDNCVKVSRSQAFNNQDDFEQLSGVTVQIRNNNTGATNLLNEVYPGVYSDSTLIGEENTSYTLIVEVEGQSFSATSFLNPRVELDSLSVQTDPFGGGDEQKYRVNCHFKDPSNVENFYRFKGYLLEDNQFNQVDGFLAISDEFFDGLETFFPYFDGSFDEGDTVRLDFLSIDEVNYRYFTAIELSQQGEVPGNPISNLSSETAVGYFGAYAKSSKTIIIEP